jgi:hypothetical protein
LKLFPAEFHLNYGARFPLEVRVPKFQSERGPKY